MHWMEDAAGIVYCHVLPPVLVIAILLLSVPLLKVMVTPEMVPIVVVRSAEERPAVARQVGG